MESLCKSHNLLRNSPKCVFYKNILFPENMRKKCSDLKSGFWKGFPTEINITRQPYNRKKIADKLSIYQGLGYKSRWVPENSDKAEAKLGGEGSWGSVFWKYIVLEIYCVEIP